MSYLGKVDMNDANIKHYSLTGSTATTVDIGWVPPSEQSLRVTINGVVQQGGTFSLSGSNLTLGGALVATDDLEVVGIQRVGNLITPADNSVSTAKLADDAVTLAKMADGTQGGIIHYGAAGAPVELAAGTDGYFLKTQGAGANPVWASAGGGKLLQVIQSVKTDTDSTSSTGTSFVDIAGTDQAGSGSVWCVKITPSAATSKILCSYSITVSNSGSATTNLVLVRDSTDICIADAASSRVRATGIGEAAHNDGLQTSSHSFLDEPSSTSELTYKITWAAISGHSAYCNRSKTDTDSSAYQRAASTITVMEIGA